MAKDDNEIRNKIKALLAENGMTLTETIAIMNEKHPDRITNQQNITNKMARQTIRFSEVIDIADAIGYDVVFKKRES